MTVTAHDWAPYARRLADGLWQRGDLTTTNWRRAFAEVPRHTF